jgi:hypothetical protein
MQCVAPDGEAVFEQFGVEPVDRVVERVVGPSQSRQWGDAVLRTLVTPGSVAFPFSANCGDGIPQRAIASSPGKALTAIAAASAWSAAIGTTLLRGR